MNALPCSARPSKICSKMPRPSKRQKQAQNALENARHVTRSQILSSQEEGTNATFSVTSLTIPPIIPPIVPSVPPLQVILPAIPTAPPPMDHAPLPIDHAPLPIDHAPLLI